MTDRRPAFYAATGPAGEWWTLLHPPYTAWHLSYVAIGAALAPRLDAQRLVATLLAFFLAVGVAAHALDELHGRPLRTSIPSPVLAAAATAALAGAVVIGALGVTRTGPVLVPFIIAGAFLVAAYNLELFDGRFHTDAAFATAWAPSPCSPPTSPRPNGSPCPRCSPPWLRTPCPERNEASAAASGSSAARPAGSTSPSTCRMAPSGPHTKSCCWPPRKPRCPPPLVGPPGARRGTRGRPHLGRPIRAAPGRPAPRPHDPDLLFSVQRGDFRGRPWRSAEWAANILPTHIAPHGCQ